MLKSEDVCRTAVLLCITSWALWLHLDCVLVASILQLLPNKPEVDGINSATNPGEYSHRRDQVEN